jgi:hypothetical protein
VLVISIPSFRLALANLDFSQRRLVESLVGLVKEMFKICLDIPVNFYELVYATIGIKIKAEHKEAAGWRLDSSTSCTRCRLVVAFCGSAKPMARRHEVGSDLRGQAPMLLHAGGLW